MHPPTPAAVAAPTGARDDIDDRMASVLEALARLRSITGLERLGRASEAAGIAAYHWLIAPDQLSWSGPVETVLGLRDTPPPESGRGYASLIDPAADASRFDAVMRPAVDPGAGVAFSVTYPLRRRPDEAERVLIEDTGRWYAGPDGRPAEVCGVVRRVDQGGVTRLVTTPPDVDPQTGVAARAWLLAALAEAIAEAERTGYPCAFLTARIANLQAINDAAGAAAAEAVIAATGRRLRQAARTSDTVGRLTGSTFGVVLRRCNRDQLRIIGERVLAATRSGVETDGDEAGLAMVWPDTVFGGALAPDHAGTAAALQAAAEDALVTARRPGTPLTIFDPANGQPSLRSLTARSAADIAAALAANRFRLSFRPVVAGEDGSIAIHETSLDVLDAEGGRTSARHLTTLAETLGVVRLIDSRALALALDVLAADPEIRLLVPVSHVSAGDRRWQLEATAALVGRGDLAGRLVVAISCRLPAEAMDSLANSLRETGAGLALAGAVASESLTGEILVADPALTGVALAAAKGARAGALQPLATLATAAKAAGRISVAGPVDAPEDAEALRALGIDWLWGPLFGDFSPLPRAHAAYRLEPKAAGVAEPAGEPEIPVGRADGASATPLSRARAALERARAAVSGQT